MVHYDEIVSSLGWQLAAICLMYCQQYMSNEKTKLAIIGHFCFKLVGHCVLFCIELLYVFFFYSNYNVRPSSVGLNSIPCLVSLHIQC